MSIWAIGDLHLAFSNPSKDMSFFGHPWENYAEKIEAHWINCIQKEDIVLIPGDICWANNLENAKIDLEWLEKLPGTKVISKGNHDYWWASNAKMEANLPPSIHFIHNNAVHLHVQGKKIAFGGTRLWDCTEYDFMPFITFKQNPRARKESTPPTEEQTLEIFKKEQERLRISLKCMDPNADYKIALIHYPPIGASLLPSTTSDILEEFKVDICVFGHLHNVKENTLPFGSVNGTKYVFTSADYLDFKPIKIL